MNLRQLFGIFDSKLDWRFSFVIGFSLIIPQLILISFILIVGRLIYNSNIGVFSNEFLYETINGIISYIILIIFLLIFLRNRKIPIIISIILATVISRIPDFFTEQQIILKVFYMLTSLLFFVFIDMFLHRFKNSVKGIIILFLLTTILNNILVNITYVILFYQQFGFEMISVNIENGDFLKKLLSYISGGLVLTLLFGISYIILNKLILKISTTANTRYKT